MKGGVYPSRFAALSFSNSKEVLIAGLRVVQSSGKPSRDSNPRHSAPSSNRFKHLSQAPVKKQTYLYCI